MEDGSRLAAAGVGEQQPDAVLARVFAGARVQLVGQGARRARAGRLLGERLLRGDGDGGLRFLPGCQPISVRLGRAARQGRQRRAVGRHEIQGGGEVAANRAAERADVRFDDAEALLRRADDALRPCCAAQAPRSADRGLADDAAGHVAGAAAGPGGDAAVGPAGVPADPPAGFHRGRPAATGSGAGDRGDRAVGGHHQRAGTGRDRRGLVLPQRDRRAGRAAGTADGHPQFVAAPGAGAVAALHSRRHAGAARSAERLGRRAPAPAGRGRYLGGAGGRARADRHGAGRDDRAV
ncbi:hypothetical protein G6F68_011011 [Rhizopus microsporus]|nr:hypothetical protein G6F68_011011 [Rhizopus microsporus]